MHRPGPSAALLLAGCAAAPSTTPPSSGPPPPLVPAEVVDIDNYQHLIDDVLFTRLGDDRGAGPEHDLARDNIVAALQQTGLTVELEPFEFESNTWFNVVATQAGTDDPSVIIVVGAHFDSVDNPGADDNATGTALVLELARALAPFSPAVTVKYVLFDREEQGKVGSQAFVASHADQAIAMAITTDMIGQDHGDYSVDLFSTEASLAVTTAFQGAVEQYGGGLTGNLLTGEYSFSDHWSFESAGIGAFVAIENDYGANDNYHQPTDASDLYDGYIDYDYVEGLLVSFAGFLIDEAGFTSQPVTP